MKKLTRDLIENLDTEFGICKQLTIVMNQDLHEILVTQICFICNELGIFSGRPNYPICMPSVDPSSEYQRSGIDGRRWDHTTEYGMRRIVVFNELLKFIESDERFN